MKSGVSGFKPHSPLLLDLFRVSSWFDPSVALSTGLSPPVGILKYFGGVCLIGPVSESILGANHRNHIFISALLIIKAICYKRSR